MKGRGGKAPSGASGTGEALLRVPSGFRVLILSGGISGGHRMVGEALREVFERHEIVATHFNALDMTWRPVTSAYRTVYRAILTHAPWIWGWIYRTTRDRHRAIPPWKTRLHGLYNRLQGRVLERHLEETQPALVLCTHYYPCEVASRMRREGRLRSRIVFVLTDHEPHPFHLFDEVDLFTVPTERARAALLERGLPERRVAAAGIPVRAAFGQVRREAARRALELDPSRPVVLVLGGMLGLGRAFRTVRDLRRAVPEAQILIVCGRNARLRERLARKWEDDRGIRPLGYVRDMASLMAASDLAVGKPGGATTAELLACGVPFLVVDAIPGQEEANVRFLQNTGAGAVAPSRRHLGPWARSIVGESSNRAAMRGAALAAGRVDAAEKVVRTALADFLVRKA